MVIINFNIKVNFAYWNLWKLIRRYIYLLSVDFKGYYIEYPSRILNSMKVGNLCGLTWRNCKLYYQTHSVYNFSRILNKFQRAPARLYMYGGYIQINFRTYNIWNYYIDYKYTRAKKGKIIMVYIIRKFLLMLIKLL